MPDVEYSGRLSEDFEGRTGGLNAIPRSRADVLLRGEVSSPRGGTSLVRQKGTINTTKMFGVSAEEADRIREAGKEVAMKVEKWEIYGAFGVGLLLIASMLSALLVYAVVQWIINGIAKGM